MKRTLLTGAIMFPLLCFGCFYKEIQKNSSYVAPVYEDKYPVDAFLLLYHEFFSDAISSKQQHKTGCIESATLHKTDTIHLLCIPLISRIGRTIFIPGKYGMEIDLSFFIKFPTNKPIAFCLLPNPILLIGGKEYLMAETKIVGELSSEEIQKQEKRIKKTSFEIISSITTPTNILESTGYSSCDIWMELFFYIDKEDLQKAKENCQLKMSFQIEVEKQKFDIPFKIQFPYEISNNDECKNEEKQIER